MTDTPHMARAREILLKHEGEMRNRLNALMPRGGNGVSVRGEYPVFTVSAQGGEAEESELSQRAFQLQYVLGSGGIHFTKGRVAAGPSPVVPTIGIIPVDNDPPPTLPRLGGGGQVFAEYRWTLNPAYTAPDWLAEFVSCKLVQNNLGDAPPNDVLPYTGFNTGVDTTEGVAHSFLMAYDAQGRILTYGQSLLLPPDPDDLSPSDYVISVLPLVRYVA